MDRAECEKIAAFGSSYVWTRPTIQPAFEHCYPVASMYKAYSRKR